jgi:hypothetical protein
VFFDPGSSSLEGYMANSSPVLNSPPVAGVAGVAGAASELTPSIQNAQKQNWWASFPVEYKVYTISILVIVIALVVLCKYAKKVPVRSLADFAPWTPVVS